MTIKKAVKNRTAGLQKFIAAGRPTKKEFIRVYGKRGHLLTWTEREELGVSAEQFQAALAKKAGK